MKAHALQCQTCRAQLHLIRLDFTMTPARHRHNLRLTGGTLALLLCTACLPFSTKDKDYSGFTSYAFAQKPGLGFCGDASKVFAAKITRSSSGEMSFAPTNLRASTAEPDACETEGGFVTETGCMMPQAAAARTLTTGEAQDVSTMFAKVAVQPRPQKECRLIAFDPCKIDEHIWDQTRHTDYMCSSSRLESEQSDALVALLTRLRNASPN
jgi:hypothetical protein